MEATFNGEDFAVGCRLHIKTTLGDEFEGTVLTFDQNSNIIIFQERTGNVSRQNVRFLKANYIREFELLEKGEDPLGSKKFSIDTEALQAREEATMRQLEAEAERIGIGVTPEAQSIFDALSKTLPVQWEKTTIVVMNEVRVNSPYLPENVTGGIPAANERVRKVLENERRRLQVRNSTH